MPTFTLAISSFPLSHSPLFSYIFLFSTELFSPIILFSPLFSLTFLFPYCIVFSRFSLYFLFVFSHFSFSFPFFSLPSFFFFHHFPPESGVAAGAETRAPRGNQSAKEPCHNILFILQPFCKRANVTICHCHI